jgi:outer membrane protein assembly factor BamB
MLLLPACSDWLQPGFGPTHTNYNSLEKRLTVDNVDDLEEIWSDSSSLTSLLVSGDLAYGNWQAGTSLGVRALDLDTGATAWNRTLAANQLAGYSQPVAFVGDELWRSYVPDAPRMDMTALDPETGDVIRTETTSFLASPPVTLGDQVVWVEFPFPDPSAPATLRVLDRATRATVWTYTFPVTSGGDNGTPIPTLRDGRIYVANGTLLYGFDATGCGAPTCEPLWVLSYGAVGTPTAGGSGRVFVVYSHIASNHGATWHESRLIAVDGATGAEEWSVPYAGRESGFSLQNGGITGVAVAGDVAYVLGYREMAPDPTETTLTAFRIGGGCTGSTCALWSADVAGSAIAVAGGVVYVGTQDAVVAYPAAGCGAATCAEVAELPVTGGASGLIVARGKVLVSTAEGITAFGLP